MPISSEDFRDVLRHFPSGVTVVTIKPYGSDEVHGLTISAFASVSPDPPLILISIDHRASAYQLMETAGTTFAINILGHDQMELSDRFPDQNIDWVLFTAIDANEHVVDAGGGLI